MAVLTGLQLRNIALIDCLELDFEAGFTVLTGETGAGKSILLDALDAVLGGAQGSAGVRLLRGGCDRGSIEASFLLNDSISAWLRQEEIDADDEDLLITREWRQQGERVSSRSRLNGVAVNRRQLLDLRPRLIDLTIQGQSQQLSRPGQQRRWLDRFGGKDLQDPLTDVRRCWLAWQEAAAALHRFQAEAELLEQQRHDQQALLDDLEQAALDDPDEQLNLEREQDRLVHGVRLQQGLAVLLSRLREGEDQVPSLLEHLSAAVHELHGMAQLDRSVDLLRDQALDLEAGFEELLRSLDRYAAVLDSEPERLDHLQERLAQLRTLQRRHGNDLPGLITLRDSLRQRLAPGACAADLDRLIEREAATRQSRDTANDHLHRQRQQTGERLKQALMELLRPMGLADVRFEVQLQPDQPADHGADLVRFLFSANPGQPLEPLVEVASGGEMSRFLLALKTLLAGIDGSSTLLFDEIDAGVSGRISGAMGELLRSMARHRQVFCVTHQPLVAALADHHYRVSKEVCDGVTHSRVSHLRDTHQRQQELAELAGGEQARAYAATLLDRKAS